MSFGDECREAFARLSAERASIALDTPGHRTEAAAAFRRKTKAIDNVLDQYNAWVDLGRFDVTTLQ